MLNILSEGPNSPARIHRRLEGQKDLTLNGLCHHINVLLDGLGWKEVSDLLRDALGGVLEAHARSAERCQESGEEKKPVRVVMMQFPIGREDPNAD